MALMTSSILPANTIVAGLAGTSRYGGGAGVVMTYGFATTADHLTNANSHSTTLEIRLAGSYNPLSGNTGIDLAIKTDMVEAMRAISSVANITFQLDTNANNFGSLDFKVFAVDGLGIDEGGGAVSGLNGIATFPGDDPHQSGTGFEGYLYLNSTASSMTTNPIVGATTNRLHTIIHETLHCLGIAHPHDEGGNSLRWTGPGNTDGDDHPLDNDRYTVMSYERGGLNVNQQSLQYGYAASPMALDIAALQQMYGSVANNTLNNIYYITDPGTYLRDLDGGDGSVNIGQTFYSIWDTAGVDTIRYFDGNNHVLINLNEATLTPNSDTAQILQMISDVGSTGLYATLSQELKDDISNSNYHAGGFLSRVFDDAGNAALGGYTIGNGLYASPAHAAGAAIENADGGQKSDILIGNEQDNVLTAFGGDDVVHGSDGRDSISGGNGNDTLFGGGGDDLVVGDANNDYLLGGDGNDQLLGGEGADVLFFDFGADAMHGGAGIDYVSYAVGSLGSTFFLNAPSGNTGLATGDTFIEVEGFFLTQGDDSFIGDLNNNFIFAQGGNDFIYGGGGGDIIFGEGGNDIINSGPLSDLISGGDGSDTFYYSINQVEGDQILDFVSGVDKFQFDDVGFNVVYQIPYGGINFFSTTSGVAPGYAAGQSAFIYYSDLGLLYADTDGAGGNNPNLIAALSTVPALTVFDISFA